MLRAVSWCSVSTAPQAIEEKDSIPSQIAQNRIWCEQNHAELVAELIVPGHSRNYIDIHECAADMLAQNCTAFSDLLDLWHRHAFDVLLVRDGSRFARTQALHAYVVEKTISIGARIFSFADGMIDKNSFRMFTAMSGYKAATDNDTLMKYRKLGMDRRARRGLPTGTAAMSHKLIRDERGKAVRLEVNHDLDDLWRDLATVLLSGTPFGEIEYELFTRYGHANPRTGRQYSPCKFYLMMRTPLFWGHTGTNYKKHYGAWAWDDNAQLPPGIVIYRNTHDPVYTGELAEQIKAELRRGELLKGRSSRKKQYWFSGLVICDECKCLCSAFKKAKQNKTYMYVRCSTNKNMQYRQGTYLECSQGKVGKEQKLHAYVDAWLRQIVTSDDLAFHFSDNPEDGLEARYTTLNGEIVRLETAMADLINTLPQISAGPAKTATISAINRHNDQIAAKRTQLAQLRYQMEQALGMQRQRAFDRLKSIGVDGLWQLEAVQINQLLFDLMGRWRFRMRAGEFVGRMKYFRGKMR